MYKEINTHVVQDMKMDVYPSSEGNVWKYVFSNEKLVLETVLYKYNSFQERTVICCSVQSGCAVGCTFCGTGNHFIGNISGLDILTQVGRVLADQGIDESILDCENFQIMFMSMGEPMMNWPNVKTAISLLNSEYPHAKLLLSTVGIENDAVFNDLIEVSKEIDKVGLQFSIHAVTDEIRDILIPFKKKYSLRGLRDRGIAWSLAVGRPVYLNYCIDEYNSSEFCSEALLNLFTPHFFHFTFSVICEADETMKGTACSNLPLIRKFESRFIAEGCNTRIFDPAGQDDIGGGCGQLWFVQDFLNTKKGEYV